MEAKKTYGQYCALAKALDQVGGRWTLLIVRELLLGPKRFVDLRSSLPGIATNLLADRLKALEAEGIIARERVPPPAPATLYRLTESGRELEEPVLALIRWGGRFIGERAPEEAFEPGWLILALRAIAPPTGTKLRRSYEIRSEGAVLHVDSKRTGSDVQAGPAPDPDAVVQADAEVLLGVFGGVIGLLEAVRGGRARADGNKTALRELDRLLRGAR